MPKPATAIKTAKISVTRFTAPPRTPSRPRRPSDELHPSDLLGTASALLLNAVMPGIGTGRTALTHAHTPSAQARRAAVIASLPEPTSEAQTLDVPVLRAGYAELLREEDRDIE